MPSGKTIKFYVAYPMEEEERKRDERPTLGIILHTYLISQNKYFPLTSFNGERAKKLP